MGFIKSLFKKNSIEDEDATQVANGDDLNLKDPMVRERYVLSCLEQMKEASEEIDRINDEYGVVTSYLTDMEEIEGLKGDDKKNLEDVARHLHELRKAHDAYVTTPSAMTDSEFKHMENFEDEVEDAIKKLNTEEDYRGKVKNDLKRIDKERKAYSYRRHEVKNSIENMRGIAVIVIVAAVVLVVILLALQLLLDLDVSIGYYVAVMAVAVAITVIYLKYNAYVKEQGKIDATINELILLENKVKIRYVNNKNLLDYLYTKYEVESADKLKDRYERYLKEKSARRSFERNEAVYEAETSSLVRMLRNFRIKDPEIWIHQSDAIYDNREMVEIRHRLIGRRQKLRKQLEYNEQIAIEASDEVKEVMRNFPEAAPGLLELVNKYGQN